MPERPDVTAFLYARTGRCPPTLWRVQPVSPFVLRCPDPPLSAWGKAVRELRRMASGSCLPDDDLSGDPPDGGRRQVAQHNAEAERIALAATSSSRARRADGGGHEAPRVALSGARRGGGASDRGGLEVLDSTRADFTARLMRCPYAHARRGPAPQRHRERVLMRFFTQGAASHLPPDGRAGRAPVRRNALDARRMDRTPASGHRRELSREGHAVPPRDGGPRKIPPALSGVRHSRSTHPLRRQRDGLLPHVPDGRKAPRRPGHVEIAEG